MIVDTKFGSSKAAVLSWLLVLGIMLIILLSSENKSMPKLKFLYSQRLFTMLSTCILVSFVCSFTSAHPTVGMEGAGGDKVCGLSLFEDFWIK